VSLVERGDGGLAETLTEGDGAGIDQPQIEVLVGLLQLGSARQVGVVGASNLPRSGQCGR
jgi:hypothetical protein